MPSLRNAFASDAARLAELSRQLGYPSTEAEIASRLAGLLTNDDHAVFVVEEDGEVAAWIQVSLSRLVESPLSAEVGGLVVDERHRRRGFGPLLLGAGDAWAKERRFAHARAVQRRARRRPPLLRARGLSRGEAAADLRARDRLTALQSRASRFRSWIWPAW